MFKKSIFWYRRDLRLDDNSGLFNALKKSESVLCVFIFDSFILEKLEDKTDKRLVFIHHYLEKINKKLNEHGSGLLVKYGNPKTLIPEIAVQENVQAVFTNKDYEPAALDRDNHVALSLKEKGILFEAYKDQVIFEEKEIIKDDGTPYTVFTPYSRKWKKHFFETKQSKFPSEELLFKTHKQELKKILSLDEIGFSFAPLLIPSEIPDREKIIQYSSNRDFPAKNATSKLSVHLRFGTISIRKLAYAYSSVSESWLNELIWREFYKMILFHFPHVVCSAFKPAYNRIPWENNEEAFFKWCEGKTGIPIVDAGMRELNTTGFMHNRVRMIVASFLTKNLLIDWKLGEAYFAKKLLDFDLSANNGGWQWAASSGCDAAPYFRVFNPSEQQRKFDSQAAYVREWIPELEELSYPGPIVDLKSSREKAIKTYKNALST